MAYNVTVCCGLAAPGMCRHATSLVVGSRDGTRNVNNSMTSVFSSVNVKGVGDGMGGRLVTVRSPTILLRANGELGLSISCTVSKHFRGRTLCNTSLPIAMSFMKFASRRDKDFGLRLGNSNSCIVDGLGKIAHSGLPMSSDSRVANEVKRVVHAPLNGVGISGTPTFARFISNRSRPMLCMSHSGICTVASHVGNSLSTDLDSIGSAIVSLACGSILTGHTRSIVGGVVVICHGG